MKSGGEKKFDGIFPLKAVHNVKQYVNLHLSSLKPEWAGLEGNKAPRWRYYHTNNK